MKLFAAILNYLLELSARCSILSPNENIQKSLVQQSLFGGALSIAIPINWRDVSDIRQVPDHQEVFQDCSAFSPLLSKDGSGQSITKGTGGCLIIEILERQEEVKDENAAAFFFQDLAQANGGKDDEDFGCYDKEGTAKLSGLEKVNTFENNIEYSKVWTVGTAKEDLFDTVVDEGKGKKTEKKNYRNEKNLMPRLSARVKACTCVGTQHILPSKSNKGSYGNEDIDPSSKKSSVVQIELCAIRLDTVLSDLLITLTMPIHSGKENGGKNIGGGHSALFEEILASFMINDWSLFV